MSKATTKEVTALLETASEMFDETGCVPGIDGEEVRAETMVPDAKQYISESIDNPEVLYDPKIFDTPGFTLVLSWLAQKWQRRCHKLVPRASKNPEQQTIRDNVVIGSLDHLCSAAVESALPIIARFDQMQQSWDSADG